MERSGKRVDIGKAERQVSTLYRSHQSASNLRLICFAAKKNMFPPRFSFSPSRRRVSHPSDPHRTTLYSTRRPLPDPLPSCSGPSVCRPSASGVSKDLELIFIVRPRRDPPSPPAASTRSRAQRRRSSQGDWLLQRPQVRVVLDGLSRGV